MASNNDRYFTSSPVVLLPPNPPNSYFNTSHYATDSNDNQMTNGFNNALIPNDSMLPTPGSLAGRKRSRGDVHAPEEDIQGLGDGSVNTPALEAPAKPRGEPIYGHGMTLIYPDDPGYEAGPESQSGTWVEERTERNQWQLLNEGRPPINARKSQRMDAGASGPDDLAQLVLPPQMREVTSEPLIDEATRALGISWTRMDSTESLQISQAAYAKWIQNHYPGLKDVAVWFENSALPGYLVAAQSAYKGQSEYYIFSHDLTEARLVTSDPAQLVPRLQMLPALHLAAPGGHIKAETDSVSAPAPAATKSMYYERMSEDFSMHPAMLRGYFPSMDMDMD